MGYENRRNSLSDQYRLRIRILKERLALHIHTYLAELPQYGLLLDLGFNELEIGML